MRPLCANCGEVIVEMNFAMGSEWMHVDPDASFPTTHKGTAWRHCKTGQVATPLGVATRQPTLDDLRRSLTQAQTALEAEVARTCPGDHQPVQHRDGKPRWCAACGRGWDGRMWRGNPDSHEWLGSAR